MYPIIAAILLGATPDSSLVADHGEVRTGPPLVHTFTLTHPGGGGAFSILGVEASCGCLAPTVSRTELNPGEAASVTLIVNTLTQPAGPNTWRVTVRGRRGDTVTTTEFRLSAVLKSEVSVTPPALAISTSGVASQTLTVTDRREKPLTIESATATSPHLHVAVGLAVASAGVRTQPIDLTVTAAYPVGRVDETIVLLTDDPECRELRVPVRVVKRSPESVVATPAVIDLNLPRDRAEASRLIQLRAPNGAMVRIDRVEAGHPQVRAKWSDSAGTVATVRVIVASQGEPAGTTDVRVILAEPAGQVVVVPVGWSTP